jgi:hypothetical protein
MEKLLFAASPKIYLPAAPSPPEAIVSIITGIMCPKIWV